MYISIHQSVKYWHFLWSVLNHNQRCLKVFLFFFTIHRRKKSAPECAKCLSSQEKLPCWKKPGLSSRRLWSNYDLLAWENITKKKKKCGERREERRQIESLNKYEEMNVGRASLLFWCRPLIEKHQPVCLSKVQQPREAKSAPRQTQRRLTLPAS